jgi:hypothetical protein
VDFSSRKNRRLRSGANPRSWVPEASMLNTRPPKPLDSIPGPSSPWSVAIPTELPGPLKRWVGMLNIMLERITCNNRTHLWPPQFVLGKFFLFPVQ